ncbi:MAG: thiamine pyrophosphate-dependent enzyme, partial [Pseudomonadota bacterium]
LACDHGLAGPFLARHADCDRVAYGLAGADHVIEPPLAGLVIALAIGLALRPLLRRRTDPAAQALAAIAAARRMLPDETIATVDSGAHRILLSQMWETKIPRTLLQSTGLCTMGCAVPLALGAKLADPSRPCVAFTGDAGLLMILGELASADELDLPIIVVVFVDRSLALIDIKQRQRQLKNAGVDFARSDFAAIAQAMGGNGIAVRSTAEMEAAVTAARDADRFTVIAVEIERESYDGSF